MVKPSQEQLTIPCVTNCNTVVKALVTGVVTFPAGFLLGDYLHQCALQHICMHRGVDTVSVGTGALMAGSNGPHLVIPGLVGRLSCSAAACFSWGSLQGRSSWDPWSGPLPNHHLHWQLMILIRSEVVSQVADLIGMETVHCLHIY